MRKQANLCISVLVACLIMCGIRPVLAKDMDIPPTAKTTSINPVDNIRTSDNPISFRADDVTYDQKSDLFTAHGEVEIYQDNQIVLADQVLYDKAHDTVTASGHVTLVDKDGQVYFAKHLMLQNTMKSGFANDIGLMFTDGSRFAAKRIDQPTADKVVLRNAVYSPCNLCKTDPRKAPLWQIRASKVVDDRVDQDIYYHNARFEAYGVPVVYLPYFSHPEPQVVARSGVLEPTFSADSKIGTIVRGYYYYTIDPTKDATLELTSTQKNGAILGGQWRQVFDRGRLNIRGSANDSVTRDGTSEHNIVKYEGFRGHVFANGDFGLTDTWRTGFAIRRTTDQFYLKDFDYSNDNVLNNEVYAERYDNRDYTRISGDYFQDLRPDIIAQQPNILPWAKDMRFGDPNSLLGGRWALDTQFVNLLRDSELSVARLSVAPSWKRDDIIDPIGLKTSIEAKLRSDNYWVQKNSPFDTTTPLDDPNIGVSRLFPSTTLQTSYPLVRPSRNVTAVIEPKAALTLAPNISQNGTIPNEDSRDVQIDTSNLFSDNRFPGFDRVESGNHAAYGVKVGGYNDNNSLFVTVGQSYSFTNNTIFPDGSGLENHKSDYVGQIETTFQNKLYLDYSFQLNNKTFASERQEGQMAIIQPGYEAGVSYLSAAAIEGTGLTQNREQIGLNVAKRLNETWSTAVSTRNDLSGDAGLLNAGLALQYRNECFRATLRGERDLTSHALGGGGSSVLFSIGLRNLGGYSTPLLKDDSLFTPFGTRPKI